MPRRPSSRRDPLLLALVGLPVVGAVTTLVVQLYLATWGGVDLTADWLLSTALFGGWGALPFAASVVVGVSVQRHWRAGSPAAIIGALLLLAFTVWLLWVVLTDESSTAVLGLLFAPFMQAALIGLTMAAAVGVAKLRLRRAVRAA